MGREAGGSDQFVNRLRSLLAFLVLRADSPQSREQLAALLWPDSDEGQARTNLRQLLHHFRRALPASCSLFICDNDLLQWQRSPNCAVDVYDFDRSLEQAAEAACRRDTAAETIALGAAVELYQEELARELYDEWLTPMRDRYRQQFAYALGRLAVRSNRVVITRLRFAMPSASSRKIRSAKRTIS